MIHAGLRGARPNLAANSQRLTLAIPGLKIILASHKKDRYYASHRMLKRRRRGANPGCQVERKLLPTCHGCLLHPPPLVDLARDLTISGFFLFPRDSSLILGMGLGPTAKRQVAAPDRYSRFPLEISHAPGRKALQLPDDDCVAAMPRFRRIRPPCRSDRTRMGGPEPGVTFCPGDLHFLIAAIYERYTCPG